MSADDTLRAAFEATMRLHVDDFERGRQGHYVWRQTQVAWDAYRAGRAAALEEAAKACDAEASIEGIAQRCAARIRALEAK